MRHAHICDQQIADDGIGVGRKRVAPLLPVFGVSPPGLMRGDVALCGLLERHRRRLLGPECAACLATLLYRVNTGGDQLARLARGVSRSGESDTGEMTA